MNKKEVQINMGTYITVFCFIAFDILTGLLKSFYKGNINSTALREGLFHKVSEVLVVVGSGLLEYGADYIALGIDLPLVNVVTVYICLTELASIIENVCEVNPKLAKLFKPYLQKLKEEEKEKEEEKDD